ncbi:MAG: PaaI family thioesterase [Desulfatiglans sp.]|jgi:uncharacterized protein (TIGR00369 family)|nr:PaaI family thioesterase [Desulfatiglans sp.]
MEMTQEILDRLNNNTLYNSLGITIEEADKGRARSRLEPNADLCWPFPGQPHGGILFTQMDTTLSWAICTLLESGQSCTTINLDIQFTSRAQTDLIICSAWATHRTKRMSFGRADIHDQEGNLLAIGQGAFRIIKDSMF